MPNNNNFKQSYNQHSKQCLDIQTTQFSKLRQTDIISIVLIQVFSLHFFLISNIMVQPIHLCNTCVVLHSLSFFLINRIHLYTCLFGIVTVKILQTSESDRHMYEHGTMNTVNTGRVNSGNSFYSSQSFKICCFTSKPF